MKKKSSILITLTLSAACVAIFSSCFAISPPNSSNSSGINSSTNSSNSSGINTPTNPFNPSEIEDIKKSQAFAEEVLAILQNEKDAVAFSNELQLTMSVTANKQSQTADFRISSVENVKNGEADLFLEGVVTNGSRMETMLQDVFMRDDLVFSTNTYKNKEDKNTQELMAIDSAEEVLNEAMGGLLGTEIPLEAVENNSMESLVYFVGEYGGLSKDQGAYVLDFNETLYNAIKFLLPTVESLDKKTTVGEFLREKEVKRFIDASCKDMTAGEFHDGLSSVSGLIGFELPIKTEDVSKSVYEYLVVLTKTEGFMSEATEGDTLLYNATVDEVLRLYNSNVEKLVKDVREFIKEGEGGITLSLGDASSKVEFSLSDFVVTYQVSGEEITAQEVDLTFTLAAQGQTIEMQLGVAAEKFDKAQTLTDLSERTVSVTEYTLQDRLYDVDLLEYVTPYKEKEFMIIAEGGEVAQVAVADSYYEERTYAEYDAQTGMYAYSSEGVEMLAKIVPNIEDDKMWVELYEKNRPNELFNYFYIEVDVEEKKKQVPFEEFLSQNDEEPSTGVVNGIKLKLNKDGDSYTVMGFSGLGQAIVNIPESYDGKPITVIGSSAFYKNETIVEVTIPSTVKTVQSYAFASCPNLKKATVHATVIENEAFKWDSALESVILSKAKRIGRDAFQSCQVLKDVTLSENLYIVEQEAFHYCSNAEIKLPKSLTIVGKYAFANCEKIEAFDCPNVVRLDEGAFQYCKNIASVTIPSTITKISNSAFRSCEGLTKLEIGNKVTEIGELAFSKCTSLEKVTIPASVTSIWRDAFAYCAIKELYLPDSVQNLGSDVFGNCADLVSVRLPNGITRLGGFDNCDKLTSIELPSSLIELSERAFSNCDGLVSIVIPEGVTSIASSAFSGCNNLESVTLPESLRNINYKAFEECPKLKTLTLSANVSYIGSRVFAYSGIETIVYKGTMEQWKNISRGGDDWKEYMGDVVIQCTDGKLDKNDKKIV